MGLILELIPKVPFLVWPLIASLLWGGVARMELNHLRKVIAAEHKEQAAAIERQKTEALVTESVWKERANEVQRTKQAEIDRINSALADTQRMLHSRAPRRTNVSETSAAACAGSTGSELSDIDGAFLAGEAARAEKQRAALKECYGWINSVLQSVPGTSTPYSPPR